jgi:hypothetical protein
MPRKASRARAIAGEESVIPGRGADLRVPRASIPRVAAVKTAGTGRGASGGDAAASRNRLRPVMGRPSPSLVESGNRGGTKRSWRVWLTPTVCALDGGVPRPTEVVFHAAAFRANWMERNHRARLEEPSQSEAWHLTAMWRLSCAVLRMTVARPRSF